MSPYAKSALTFLGAVSAIALFFVFRYAMVSGILNSITPTTPGLCRPVAQGLKGLTDVEADKDLVFVSAQDGIYALKRDDANAAPVKLAGGPAGFHPLGFSLYRGRDGSLSLVAIDLLSSKRYAVEIYDVSFDGATPNLKQRTTVQGGLLVSPEDTAAIGSDIFYAANDHVTTTAIGRFAEGILLWPHADVVLFNGQRMRIAAERIAGPHGVAVSPDGRFLYISDYNDRRVIGLSIEPFSGNLTELEALSLPARLEHMSFDDKGNLIVTGQTKPGSSQVFRVRRGPDGSPVSYDTLYSDDGRDIAGAVSAVGTGGHLFVAAPDRLLDCK